MTDDLKRLKEAIVNVLERTSQHPAQPEDVARHIISLMFTDGWRRIYNTNVPSFRLNASNPMATPVRTRCGQPARLLCVDLKGKRTISAAVTSQDGTEAVLTFDRDGKYYSRSESPNDLVNAGDQYLQWVNFYDTAHLGRVYCESFPDRVVADASVGPTLSRRIACIPVGFNRGDGLC